MDETPKPKSSSKDRRHSRDKQNAKDKAECGARKASHEAPVCTCFQSSSKANHCDSESIFEGAEAEVPILYEPSPSNPQLGGRYRLPLDVGTKNTDSIIAKNGDTDSMDSEQKKTYLCFYFEQPTSSGNRPKQGVYKKSDDCCTCRGASEERRPECAETRYEMVKSKEVSQSVKCGMERVQALQKCRQLTACEWKDLQYRKLARDNYCPGAMQDAADGNINYNAMVLNLMKETFGSIAKDPGAYAPMSLLEMFNKRIKTERIELKHFLVNQNSTSSQQIEAYFQQKAPNDANRAIMQYLKSENLYLKARPPQPPNYDISVSTMEIQLPNCLVATAFMGTVLPN